MTIFRYSDCAVECWENNITYLLVASYQTIWQHPEDSQNIPHRSYHCVSLVYFPPLLMDSSISVYILPLFFISSIRKTAELWMLTHRCFKENLFCHCSLLTTCEGPFKAHLQTSIFLLLEPLFGNCKITFTKRALRNQHPGSSAYLLSRFFLLSVNPHAHFTCFTWRFQCTVLKPHWSWSSLCLPS